MMATADSEEDWQNLSDAATRRRIQNRIAQRNYRRNLRRRLKELEERVNSAPAPVEQPGDSDNTVPSKWHKSPQVARAAPSSPPHRNQAIRNRRVGQRSLEDVAFTNQKSPSLGERDDSGLSLTNAFAAQGPSITFPQALSTETLPILDPITFWSLPTPTESIGCPVLSAEWPFPHASPESLPSSYPANGEDCWDAFPIGDLNDMEVDNLKGQTTLHLGARQGHKKIVTMLLDMGVPVNDPDSLGRTALHLAALEGHQDMVELLVERGADIHMKDGRGRNPLHGAVAGGHSQTARFLLERTPAQEDKDLLGRTALHIAIQCGHEEIVRLLLDHGADPRAIISP